MNFWTVMHSMAFAIYVFAIFYVIIKNPHAVANWVLAVLFLSFAVWSGGSVLLNNIGTDPLIVTNISKIQSFGWASFNTYYFLFILYLTNNKKMLSSPILYIIILLLPGIFLYQNYQGNMLVCCHKVYYGFAADWSNTVWSYVYFSYYIIMFFIGAFLLYRHGKTTRIRSEKKIAGILLSSTISVFVIGTFISVIMNYLKVSIPLDVNLVFLIFVVGFLYSAEKFETFTLSSTRNADRIMNMINEGIVLLENDGSMSNSNRAAMEIFGYPEGEETKDTCGFIEDIIKKAGVAGDGAEIANGEVTFNDASGTEKTVLVSSRVLLKGKGNSGRVCTIRDITAKKQTEVNLVETVKELKRSNEDLESFAYVASHDLKEPLRMVTSYMQLIRKKFMDKLGNDGNEYINFASEGAKRMSDLIEGLLDYSRIKRAGRVDTVVDTSATIVHVMSVMKFSILDKKADIVIKEPMPCIVADKMQLEQLFQNIIGNALKFSGKERPIVTISAEKNGNLYEFTFKDNGIGIEKMYCEKIFQIFQRLHTRAEYEGTGVGLAICKKIVETHGGKIRVESAGPGKGSSFIFTLLSRPVECKKAEPA